MLSGIGADGSNGVLAESPETARFPGMPQSVINTGCADAFNAKRLVAQADRAMYQAKLNGKNQYHVFDAAPLAKQGSATMRHSGQL